MCRQSVNRWSRRGSSLFTLAAALVFLILAPRSASALWCEAKTFKLTEAYEAADSIIVGVVTACQKAKSGEAGMSGGDVCSFDSVEVLKESSSARDYRGTATSTDCGLSLHVGNQYLLFLDRENEPMRYSLGLDGEATHTSLTHKYLRILRAFRDGQVADLADPWSFYEGDDFCRLAHFADHALITFSQRKDGAPTSWRDGWTVERVDRKTVLRAHADNISAPADMEYIVSGDLHELPDGAPVMSVNFLGRSRPVEREASIAVGNRSWPLLQQMMTIMHQGREIGNQVDYLAVAGNAEDILAAMEDPSPIVVSARLLDPPHNDPDAPAPNAPSGPDKSGQFRAANIYASAPQPAVDAGPDASAFGSQNSGGGLTSRVPPQTVLRIETRSTQLSAVIDRYRACISGER